MAEIHVEFEDGDVMQYDDGFLMVGFTHGREVRVCCTEAEFFQVVAHRMTGANDQDRKQASLDAIAELAMQRFP